MTPPSSQRFRLVIKLWLFASVAGIVWNLIPVFAKYNADQQKVVELEQRRRNPPTATVDVAEDSPWPGSTIQMQGQPVEGLDDANLPYASIQYGRLGQMVITHRNVSLVNAPWKSAAKLIRSFPNRNDGEILYSAAISGDGKVIATVGEFTQVSFWNAATGKLLQTVEDEFPTAAAEPDKSARPRKHTNGLRYSWTGARRLVAAPGGCLFAVGKIDGSVELWTAEGQKLPDRPNGLVTAEWPWRPDDPGAPPKRFHLLRRMELHEGEIQQLEFTLDCQSLVSVSGRRFLKMQPIDGPEGIPLYGKPVYDDDTTHKMIRTEVVSGTIQWEADLDGFAQTFALDHGSQLKLEGMLHSPQLAVAWNHHHVTRMSLDDGTVLNTFSTRHGNRMVGIRSMAFGDGGNLLWTVGTRYTRDAEHHSMASVSAWDVIRGKRVATAEVPGSVNSSGWNPHGTQLATLRYFNNLPAGQEHAPWAFHLWDMKIVPQKPSLIRLR